MLQHTVGNLTLTGYNPQLSNSTFIRRRELLRDSNLQMNREIAEFSKWGLEQIQERSRLLAERAINIWPGPKEETGLLDLSRLLSTVTTDRETEPYHRVVERRVTRTMAATPSASAWRKVVPELADNNSLRTWQAICNYLGIEVGTDSARRRLKQWVNEHRPQWPDVPEPR